MAVEFWIRRCRPDSRNRLRHHPAGGHRPLPGRLGSGEAAGTLATAGGLVFQGNSAYDAATGAKLWEEPLLGERPVSWISYLLDGKQYVSILARNSPNNRLFTFTLDGGATMPPLPPPAPAQGNGKGSPAPAT